VSGAGGFAVLAVALALLGAARTIPEAEPDAERPATGRYLVATEQVRGSFFEHAVVFLVNHSDSATLGLVVNRPTSVALHDLVTGAADDAGSLYMGGPVAPTSVMVLVRSGSAPEHAVRVIGDLFMTVDPAILQDGARAGGSALRAYAGHAGWGPGQLAAEIARGDWIVASEAVDAIFDDAPEVLWKKLHLRHHRVLTRTPDAIALAAGWASAP
jgi:putative transcriptional regulator